MYIENFFFGFRFTGGNRCRIKKHLYFVKLIMWKVNCILTENILADDPLPRQSRKGWTFDRSGGCQFMFLINLINCAWANYLGNHSLVQTQCCRKAQSSKPFTTNELWLLELRIKSTRILASIPDALWDMCKLSIVGLHLNVLLWPCWFKLCNVLFCFCLGKTSCISQAS